MSRETKTCQNCQADFTIDPEDFAFYEKIKVPPPTFCWLCRAQRRLAWRNERFLYKRKSDFPSTGSGQATGKEIFSMYPAESPVKVYETDIWVSDKWDPMDYGREVDFSRPFMEQLRDLIYAVPVFSRSVLREENSPYSSNFTGFKNCYLCFNGNDTEDSMYSTGIDFSKHCVDVSQAEHAEGSYDSFAIGSVARSVGSVSSGGGLSLYFCRSCIGCSDCIGCVNLRNKKFHIFNQPHSKEEYEAKLKGFGLDSYTGYQKLKKEAREFWGKHPYKYMEGLRNENVSGAYIGNSKNVKNGYFVIGGEDLAYCQIVVNGKNTNCYDYTVWGENSSWVYESAVVGDGISNVKFSHECWPQVRDSEYAFFSQNSSNLFGCSGLKNKEYCVLNKQYPKAEYAKLVARIRQHMEEMPYTDTAGRVYRYGEFVPAEFSPFAYNLTMAQDFFPLSKTEAAENNYAWQDSAERDYAPTKSPADLPDRIADAPDSVTGELILCAAWEEDSRKALEHNCTKAFRILPQELAFYRHYDLPLPRQCPNSRFFERIQNREHMRLFFRRCMCGGKQNANGKSQNAYTNTAEHFHGAEPCPNQFETSYGPDRPEIVYCEKCYNAEVA